MLYKKPNHKKFDYQPRYYNPSTDQEERRKSRLKFKPSFKEKSNRKNPFLLILLFLFIIYLFLKFQGLV